MDATERTYLLKEEKDVKKRRPKEASRSRKGFVLACCFVMQLVSNGVGFGLGVMYVEIQRAFDVPRTQAALVQSIFMGTMTAGGILYTPLINKYGTGLCVCLGTIIGCSGLVISAFSTQIYFVIIFTGVVGGLGLSINYYAPFVTASLVFREKAGVPLVFLTTGSSIGQFIFPYTYDLYITQYGWNGALLLVSGMALNCVPAGLLVYMSRDYMTAVEEEEEEKEGKEGEGKGKSGNKRTKGRCCPWDVSLLLDIMILLILSTCFFLASTGNTEVWFLVDLMTIRGYERQTGSLFVSLIGIFNFCGRATGVLLRFKLRIPTIYHWIYCMPIIGISHFLILSFTDYLPLLLSTALYGYTFGIAVAQTPAIMFEAAGLQRYASGMGFVNFCFGGGNFFGGLIGGVINDTYGEYDPAFYLAMAASGYMCLASVCVVIILKRRKRRTEPRTVSNKETNHNGYSNPAIEEDNC